MSHHEQAPVELSALATLVALVEERSVTRAATRLGMTQSGASHALRRLRSRFDDPLLVRGREGMQPTPRGLALHGRAVRILAELEAFDGPAERFDPAAATRSFTLGADDNMSLYLLPPLLAELERQAPGVNIQVMVPPAEPRHALEQGEIDLLIGPREPEQPGLYSRRLFTATFACVARRDHPTIGRRPGLERFASVGHAVISARLPSRSFVDDALAEHGLHRRVVLRLPHFLACAQVVAATDLVSTVPRLLLDALGLTDLRTFTSPIPLPQLPIHAVWQERLHTDAAHRWLRELLADIARRAQRSGGRGHDPKS
ncbi:MAG: LysR family transcriptional regulator [Myxococcota bacterium]